eukprot:TRINITY_DN4084_c0_g1_i1.p1 TRINITY_DN4084_c0_g1~~TRINITY_DN4084_c0_g1_i1.p1  ORF type:complete len:222 (+),score=37.09 TRINITY_DN4084_c0_g1_i1:1-666(+)
MKLKKVKFFYDTVSPYSYFAFEVMTRYRSILKNTELELCPFFLGGIMKLSENNPPALNKTKALYMLNDLDLQSKFFQLKYVQPPTFPINTLRVQRILVAIKVNESVEMLEKATRAFYRSNFQEFKPINEEPVIRSVLEEVSGQKEFTDKYMSLSETQEIKNKLTELTNFAFQNRCYGAPFFLIEDSETKENLSFFGSDRIESLFYFLGEKYSGPNPGKSNL